MGGIASNKYWFQQKWSDINLHTPHKKDINWRELVAIYLMLHGLSQEIQQGFRDKNIHIFTDNMASKHMLINMRAKMHHPDLQAIINDICKLCVDDRILLWMEHIPGKDSIIADALSRCFPEPFGDCSVYNKRMNVIRFMQKASDLSIHHDVKDQFSVFKDDDN